MVVLMQPIITHPNTERQINIKRNPAGKAAILKFRPIATDLDSYTQPVVFDLDEYAGEITRFATWVNEHPNLQEMFCVHVQIRRRFKSQKQKSQLESLFRHGYKINREQTHPCTRSVLVALRELHHIVAIVIEVERVEMQNYINQVALDKELLWSINRFYLALVRLLDIVAPNQNSLRTYPNPDAAKKDGYRRLNDAMAQVDDNTYQQLQNELALFENLLAMKKYPAARVFVYDRIEQIATHLATDDDIPDRIKEISQD